MSDRVLRGWTIASAVVLSACCAFAQQDVGPRKFGIQNNSLAKLRISGIQFAELAFHFAQFNVQFSGRLQGDRAT